MNDYLYSCMKNFILIGLFVAILTNVSYSDDFRYLRTREGLYDGEINSVAQDSSGFMWFATWSGLIKYDGFNFELFRPELGNPSSIPDKKIKKLFVDSEDNLWIATSSYLCRYDKFKNNFHKIQFDKEEVEINILNLQEVEKHLVIHAIDGIYIMPLVQSTNDNYKVKKRKILDDNKNSQFYFHYSFCFNNMLLLVNNNNNSPTNICFAGLNLSGGDTTINIKRTYQIDNLINDVEYVPVENNIYFATINGLIPFSLDSWKFLNNRYFQGKDVQKVVHTSNHKLFCSLSKPELLCLNLHTGKSSTYTANPYELGSLLPSNIHCLFEDFSGNLWVGHQGQGISIMNLYHKKFYSFKRDLLNDNSLNSNTIMCFEGTENEIFIGCRTGGLNIFSRKDLNSKSPDFRKLSIVPENTPAAVSDGVWDIEKQSDSLFWLGTDLGLYKLQKINNEWKIKKFNGEPEINNLIRKVFIDKNDNLWCGTFDEGLIFIPNLKQNPKGINYNYPSVSADSCTLSANLVHDIYIDSKNRFWVATIKGLNKLDGRYESLDLSGKIKPELKFKQYVATDYHDNYLNNNEINNIYENYDGTLWLATKGGGINIFDPENEIFDDLTTSDGLPSNDILAMLPDEDGNLWISTINGLASYKRFKSTPTFTVFDNSDGIQGEIFMVNSYYKSSDGQMFFGGDNGFTTFYPRSVSTNQIEPKVALSNLSFRTFLVHVGDTLSNGFILKSTINNTDRIVLPYKKSYFKIDVATLHFQEPAKNKFSYILENYMKDWYPVLTENNSVEFANLPYGKYLLKVKAINSDNVESSIIKTLQIEIQPPWYRTWYMTSLFSIFAISLIMGLIYIIVNRQRLIYQKKLDAVTIGNNENKMMFLTSIAHELRTPLSLVIAPVEDLMKNLVVDKQWKNHLQLIHRNSNYLLRLVNQIIDFRKLDAGKLILQLKQTDIVRVVKDVVLNFKGYENSRNINLYLKVPADSVYVSIDVQKIEEVLYNLISNAFKHTFDNHSITVSMQFLPDKRMNGNAGKTIRISVMNEGKEITGENQLRIFERFYKVDESIEGAGIGLSFSKSLVEMHNGNIHIESIPGKGVAFHVDLPFAQIEMNEQLLKEPEVEPVLIKSESLSKDRITTGEFNESRKILIVEDNEELREFLYNFISRNYNCSVASNGLEAMDIIQNQSPAVVISDIIMPEMDGYKLCAKIKGNVKTCHTPVILLTAKNTEEQIIEGYKVGADAYITKPFDVNLLMAQINRLIINRELIREKYRTQNFMVEVEKNSASKDEQFVKTVREILETNISDPEFNVNKLSDELNISTTQLYRRLKSLTGHSPVEFIRILKLQKAYGLLSQQNNTVKEVCYLTGFNNLSYFIKCFKEQFGTTPASFRDNGVKEINQRE